MKVLFSLGQKAVSVSLIVLLLLDQNFFSVSLTVLLFLGQNFFSVSLTVLFGTLFFGPKSDLDGIAKCPFSYNLSTPRLDLFWTFDFSMS